MLKFVQVVLENDEPIRTIVHPTSTVMRGWVNIIWMVLKVKHDCASHKHNRARYAAKKRCYKLFEFLLQQSYEIKALIDDCHYVNP